MYRMLPTALGIKQPREWIKVFPLVRATSSWELSQFSAATVYRGPTMWQILGCMCPNWFLNFLCETKLVVFPRKWPVLFGGRHSSLPTVYPAKVSAETQSTWASYFSGYGVAPRATTSTSSPCQPHITDSESSSCLSDYTLDASHRRAAWWSGIPSSLPGHVRLSTTTPRGHPSGWRGAILRRWRMGTQGLERRGEVAPFHSACERLWVP